MTWQPTGNRRTPLPAGWKALRLTIFKRDNHTCQHCGDVLPDSLLDCDHINGDDNHDPTNLQTLCRPCHKRKTNLEAHAARRTSRTKNQNEPRHPGLL